MCETCLVGVSFLGFISIITGKLFAVALSLLVWKFVNVMSIVSVCKESPYIPRVMILTRLLLWVCRPPMLFCLLFQQSLCKPWPFRVLRGQGAPPIVYRGMVMGSLSGPCDASGTQFSGHFHSLSTAAHGCTLRVRRLSWACRGTPPFSAPEVMNSTVPTVESDIFAYGGVLFQMVEHKPRLHGALIEEVGEQYILCIAF